MVDHREKERYSETHFIQKNKEVNCEKGENSNFKFKICGCSKMNKKAGLKDKTISVDEFNCSCDYLGGAETVELWRGSGAWVLLPPEVQITHLLCYNLNWLLTLGIILNKVLCILIMSRHFTEYFSSKQPNKFTLVAAKTSLE